jgi:rRNA maturation RNase YbeY
MLSFFVPTIKFNLPQKRAVRKWLQSLAEAEGKRVGEVAFIFCSDDELLPINRQYLRHDYYTDVITFDYTEGPVLSGDVFISVDTVRANAEAFRQTFDDELHRVMAHGLLHLCGYADATPQEQKQMRTKEDFYLARRRNYELSCPAIG